MNIKCASYKMSLKIFILIIGNFFDIGKIFSQNLFFNRNYDFNNEAEAGAFIAITADNEYLITSELVTTTYRGLVIFKVSSTGQLQSTKVYSAGDSTVYLIGYNIISTSDGNFLQGGAFKDLKKNIWDAMIFKINSSGDTLWTKRYGTPYIEGFTYCHENPDSTIILAGGTQAPSMGSNTDISLTKIDFTGNIIWQKFYGGSGDEIATSLIQTPDGGYMLVGYTNSYGAGDYDIYVVKTDSDGNMQWQRTFGGPLTDGGGWINKLSDSTYMITGLSYVSNVMQPYIIIIENDGTKIWDKIYFTENYGAFQASPISLSNGDVMLMGVIGEVIPPNNPLGWLMKISANGDSIWSRTFAKWDGQNYFTDIKATDDGGFIISGYAGNTTGQGGYQDMWLVKVDSCGCDTPLCDTVCAKVGVEELAGGSGRRRFVVYPNPTNNVINIDYRFDREQTGNAIFYLYDIIGKITMKEIVLNKTGKTILSLEGLTDGVYYYCIKTANSVLARNKLVILKDK